MQYCAHPLLYQRRKTREVKIGDVGVGGDNPIRIQSMLTCDTMDTTACIQQTMDLVATGCEIVRITAPTVNDAANLRHIKQGLLERGCHVPIVADIHFKPEAAMEAAQWVEKIRINPGNFADKKKFQVREYTDEQYNEEVARVEEAFAPLIKLCAERKVAMRIGVNHGSLSDRIMNRFGDTPLGMVESALEYAHAARKLGYHDLVFSMKSSNPKVMIHAYRLLASKMNELEWDYPLHLGVTEAGEGEDGRIKSAVGIGALLLDGLGDTLRVSLTEDSVREIPVARALARFVENIEAQQKPLQKFSKEEIKTSFDPCSYTRRPSEKIHLNGIELGETETIRVAATRKDFDKAKNSEPAPEFCYETAQVVEVDVEDEKQIQKINQLEKPTLITVKDGCSLHPIAAFRLLTQKIQPRHPILLKDTFHPHEKAEELDALIASSVHIGALLCDGIGDAVLVRNHAQSVQLAYNILQACGNRSFKADYVACPSCGRTLYNIQAATARIKAATQHLKGVKIAIMGCIVNGPGEMADADFGYVGGAPGKINLYVGKTPVKFNIPEAEAVEQLKALIKEHGKWIDA